MTMLTHDHLHHAHPLTPWDTNPEPTPNPIAKFSRSLVKMERIEHLQAKLNTRYLSSWDDKLPIIKLKTQLHEFKCSLPAKHVATEMDEDNNCFYIRQSRNGNDRQDLQNRSSGRLIIKRQERNRSLKEFSDCRSNLVICDLNKTTDFQIKEVSLWSKLEQDKSRGVYRLKRMSVQRLKTRTKSHKA